MNIEEIFEKSIKDKVSLIDLEKCALTQCLKVSDFVTVHGLETYLPACSRVIQRAQHNIAF